MMVMSSQDLTIIRGDDVSLTIVFTDEHHLPVDLTDATVFFTVKKSLKDTDDNALLKTETTEHIDPEQGKTVIALSHDDTNIQTGQFFYDLQVVGQDGKVVSTFFGGIEVVPDVTRRTTSE